MSTKKIKIKKNLLKEAKKALEALETFQNKNGNGNVFLFEETGTKEITFQSLLESEQTIEEIAQAWEKSATHQLDEIMGMDFGMSGAGAAGAAASAQQMKKDTAWAAVKSVNDAIIMLYIQGKDLILSALSKAAGAVKAVLGPVIGIAKRIWGAIKRFCSSHPIVCKIVAIALMVLVIFLVASILGSEAQAKITVDGKQLSDTEVNLLKGFVQDVGGHGPTGQAPDKLAGVARAAGVGVPEAGGHGVDKLAVDTVNWIDRAHRATESIELTTAQEDGGKIASEAFNFLAKLWKGKEGQGASEGIKDIFQSWVDAGKDLIGSFEQTIERSASTIRQSTKVGWDQVPSDPETGARVLPQTFQKVQQSLNEQFKRMKELSGIL
tara:strand:- start:1260 stop:2399 length:1140 start_codon:yes stop_codon:yes gene_type:complete